MTTEDRDRILQLVSYIKAMYYHAKMPLMDGSNYGQMYIALRKANELCAPVVNSLRDAISDDAPPASYYMVRWDDEERYSIAYVRFYDTGPTWGYDIEDDPERMNPDDVICINGKDRLAKEFVRSQS